MPIIEPEKTNSAINSIGKGHGIGFQFIKTMPFDMAQVSSNFMNPSNKKLKESSLSTRIQ